MKKSLRLYLTGSVYGMLFENFIKQNADDFGVKGFFRQLEDGRAEIFIEGDQDSVDLMVSLCKRGSTHSQIRDVKEKPESFQDFKEFKILKI